MQDKTKQLDKLILETDYSTIPGNLIDLAKKAILDYMGVSLAGSKLAQAATPMLNYARAIDSKKEAGIIAGKFKTDATLAALVNGTLGHALDFDDAYAVHMNSAAHPSVPILPAVFALGEKYHISGREVLTSFILGLEVESRLAIILEEHPVELGWHITPVIGSMGASAAASKILKLDISKIQNSTGIAASLAGGLKQNFGTMTKPLHAGSAARNGVEAGLLAEQGFTSNENILDVSASFFKVFSGIEPDLDRLTEGLASRWVSANSIAFKLYPSCRATHSGIDAALYLRNNYKINVDEIDEIIQS